MDINLQNIFSTYAMPNFWSMAVGNESEDSEPLVM